MYMYVVGVHRVERVQLKLKGAIVYIHMLGGGGRDGRLESL